MELGTQLFAKEYYRLPYKERESALVSTQKTDRELVGQGETICMAPAWQLDVCGVVGGYQPHQASRPQGERAIPKPFITHDTDIFPGSICVLAGEWSEAPEMSFVQ